jgi:predicted dehydrogenase
MEKNYLNWAILAPGIIANSMAQALSEMAKVDSRIRLFAVASRNLERGQEFAKKWGFQKSYASYQEMLADPEVDVVYVANPHAFHFDSVMQCLEAGKHVLCEKPAGCNLEQLNKMIKKAKEKNLFFMEAMWTAFNPCIREIKKEIAAGTIGNIINIDSRFCNRNPYDPNDRNYDPRQAGGALLDLGIYNIYFAMMLADFSPITAESSAVRMLKGVDAWNSVNLTFENGIVTSFQDAMDVPSTTGTHDAVIYGTKGFITVENFFMATKADVHVYKNIWGNENEVVREIREPFAVNGYEYECAHATEFILTGRTESDVHTFKKSEDLIDTMDALRRDWNFKYPFEN